MITVWVAVQAVVDFLILIAIIFYIYERKNRKKEEQNADRRKEELKALIKSLEQLIKESERSSADIFNQAFQSQKKSRELLDQLGKKQIEIQNEIRKSESALEKVKNQTLTEDDKYSEAAKLAKTGLNIEEISKQLDLPKGEVELILDLPLRDSKKQTG